jgi:SAM-dependent methyltransferase
MPINNLTGLLKYLVAPGRIVPVTDWHFYRMTQPDLHFLDTDGLAAHFENHGRAEGRMASPAGHRDGFIAQIARASVLEIGPSVWPTLSGPGVKYFDILDKAGLVDRAVASGLDASRAVDVDFVSPTGDLSIVNEQFDAVYSSHCIEHSPDIIQHLLEVERILPSGGRYFIIVPDKRYCFDATLPESTLAQVVQARAERHGSHPGSCHRPLREYHAQ